MMDCRMRVLWGVSLGVAGWFCSLAKADSFQQTLGVYADSAQIERRHVGIELGFDFQHAGRVEQSTVALQAGRDEFFGGLPAVPVDDNETIDEVYAYNASFSASQSLSKLTELRQAIFFNSEQQARSLTTSVGVSHWLAKETWRFSFDYMKNTVNNPQDPYLDVDFASVQRPRLVASEGVALSLRQLATPQTVIDYSAGYTSISNRPPASLTAVALRQFVVSMNGALLASVTRMENTGKLTTETTYGEVTALQVTLGWAQNLWSQAQGLVEYRNYREDEVTRAYGDELQLGSDAVTLGVDHKWSGDDQRIYHLTGKVSRYETNIDLAANVIEVSYGAQF